MNPIDPDVLQRELEGKLQRLLDVVERWAGVVEPRASSADEAEAVTLDEDAHVVTSRSAAARAPIDAEPLEASSDLAVASDRAPVSFSGKIPPRARPPSGVGQLRNVPATATKSAAALAPQRAPHTSVDDTSTRIVRTASSPLETPIVRRAAMRDGELGSFGSAASSPAGAPAPRLPRAPETTPLQPAFSDASSASNVQFTGSTAREPRARIPSPGESSLPQAPAFDDLEERIADILERAALEAGIDLA